MNEAEVRAQIIDIWLKNHGFSQEEILLERTFSIRLGQAVKSLGSGASSTSKSAVGRADYLVRSSDGRNLFILEAKGMGEPLDTASDSQAVSYARALSEGGIAPFAIVTNGIETHILDAITGELLNGQSIPLSHPHAMSRFVVSGEGLLERAEAMEHLIGLSAANLQAFCSAQVRHAMSTLRSDLLDSGMKYIPSLYTQRIREANQLEVLLGGESRCILVIGPPQVGKTNFICHTVESLLDSDVPCLFYPAIGLNSGVLDAIRSDFGWSFYEDNSALNVARRLARVVSRTGKRLILFIDGINENLAFVRAFNNELERIQELAVTTVLSLISYSAATVLLDPYGNLTPSARSAGLKKNDVFTIEGGGTSSSSKISVVSIGTYTEEETSIAYKTYADAFCVEVSEDHEKTHDPQILRSAMEVYRNRELPVRLDAKEILSTTMQEKLTRLGGLTHQYDRQF